MKDKKKIISYSCIIIGFILNFVAIVLMLIPFITRNENQTLLNIGLGIYLFVFIFIGAGLIMLIQARNKNK